MSEAAEADCLGDVALATDPLNVVLGVAVEELAVCRWERPTEPGVAETAHTDGELLAANRHSGNDTRVFDAVCCIRGRLRRRHRKPEKGVVASVEEVERVANGGGLAIDGEVE